MAQFQKSALVKKKEDALFVTASKGSFSSSFLKKIEEQLNNSEIRRVVFYFDEKGEHEKSVIEDICSLLVCYPEVEAKVFRRKNILFLQRPLFGNERLIRFPQGKIISKPGKFVYEGMLFKPKSRLYETILNNWSMVVIMSGADIFFALSYLLRSKFFLFSLSFCSSCS